MSHCEVYDPRAEAAALKARIEILERWCLSLEDRYGKNMYQELSKVIKDWDVSGMPTIREEEK